MDVWALGVSAIEMAEVIYIYHLNCSQDGENFKKRLFQSFLVAFTFFPLQMQQGGGGK